MLSPTMLDNVGPTCWPRLDGPYQNIFSSAMEASTNQSWSTPCGINSTFTEMTTLITWTTLHSIVAAMVVLFNGLVIGSFVKNRKLRTRSNSFIVSLAVADFLVGLVSAPGWFVILFHDYRYCESWFKVLEKVWTVFEIFAGVGSIFHLMALTWDRLLAISRPLTHRNYTRKMYLMILGVIWTSSIFIAGLSVEGNRTQPKAYNVSVICLCFFLPLLTIFIAQGATLWVIRQSSRNRLQRSAKMSRDVRAAITIAIMTGMFVLGWLPFFSLGLIRFAHPDLVVVPMHAIFAVKLLQYGNSMFNPILYAQKFPEFRKTYIALLCPCRSTDRLAVSTSPTTRGGCNCPRDSAFKAKGKQREEPEQFPMKDAADSLIITCSSSE